jgi:hypothetical protein
LVNLIVGVSIGGVAIAIFTSEQIADFIVGIGKLNAVTPGFSSEIVIDIVGKSFGTIVTIG